MDIVASALNVLRHCLFIIGNVEESWVQKAKACLGFFFPQDIHLNMTASQLRPQAAGGQRAWLFTFTLIHTTLSDQTPAGTHVMQFPPASTSYSQ